MEKCDEFGRTSRKNPRKKEGRVKTVRCVVQFSGPEGTEKNRIKFGGVAQLGEHLPCKQGVKSSNLFISTSKGNFARERVDNIRPQ